jgi:hypothetical protein
MVGTRGIVGTAVRVMRGMVATVGIAVRASGAGTLKVIVGVGGAPTPLTAPPIGKPIPSTIKTTAMIRTPIPFGNGSALMASSPPNEASNNPPPIKIKNVPSTTRATIIGEPHPYLHHHQ